MNGSQNLLHWGRQLALVCKADSDTTFISSDGILFKVHCTNLKSCSEGFSPPEGTIAEALEVSPTTAFDSFKPEAYIAWVSKKVASAKMTYDR